jgi:hypothetical protein
MSLRLLVIILILGLLTIPGSLHDGREDNEGPLVFLVKEALELVSQGLKFELVLLQALNKDLKETLIVNPAIYRFH